MAPTRSRFRPWPGKLDKRAYRTAPCVRTAVALALVVLLVFSGARHLSGPGGLWAGRRGGRQSCSSEDGAGSELIRVAVLSPYPPSPHGIGEWVFDHLAKGINVVCKGKAEPCPVEYGIIAQDTGVTHREYPPEVKLVVRHGVASDYLAAAQFVNANYDLLNLQHEYGMFGGPGMDDLLFQFLDEIKVPINVNFHTVLRGSQITSVEFQVHLWEVLQRVDHVTNFMPSLCNFHRSMLPDLACSFVAHGHDPHVPRELWRTAPHAPILQGRRILLSLGYLTPDKGLHFVLEALKAIVPRHPKVLYVIAGGHSAAYVGDYLQGLKEGVERSGLQGHVLFVGGETLRKREVLEWVARAEIVLTPHTWRHQISSGTITMAMGFGKAVVSSAFPYAEEYMCQSEGGKAPTSGLLRRAPHVSSASEEKFDEVDENALAQYLHKPRPCWPVPFNSSGVPSGVVLGRVLAALLDSPQLLEGTQRAALEKVKGTTWEDLAGRYIKLYRSMMVHHRAQSPPRRLRSLFPEWALPSPPPLASKPTPWAPSHLQVHLAEAAVLFWPANRPIRRQARVLGRPPQLRHYVTLGNLLSVPPPGGRPVLPALDLERSCALIFEGFGRGRLLFARWVAKAPVESPLHKAPVPVEIAQQGFFYLNNGLVTLRGDLPRGIFTYAVLTPGQTMGYGVVLQPKAVYVVNGEWFDAVLYEPREGATWGHGGGSVWRETPMLGKNGVQLGVFRASFGLSPGLMHLDIRYSIVLNANTKVSWVEVASNTNYQDRKPAHDEFWGFRGSKEMVTFAPESLRDTEVIYDAGKEPEKAFAWDVALNRRGDYALFTFLGNATFLRFISYGQWDPDDQKFFHLFHRYFIPNPEAGATFSLLEKKVMLSRVQVEHLSTYGELLSRRDDSSLLGFDLSSPPNMEAILESLSLSAMALKRKDPLLRQIKDWVKAHARQTI